MLSLHSLGSEEPAHRLEGWHERATVRSQPRRMLEPAPGQLYFPPEMIPAAVHPLVAERGPAAVEGLLARQLVHHLDFTDELEHHVVNQVAHALGRDAYGFGLSDEMRHDAYKIYVDEAYHALFSADLRFQVCRATGLDSRAPGESAFLTRLADIRDRVPSRYRDLVTVFFAIVTETIISRILAGIPGDERVVPAVREVIGDHAQDEAIHHGYFRDLLRTVWPGLPAEARLVIGPVIPELILCFLEPDLELTAEWLADLGLSPYERAQVIAESYAAPTQLDTVRFAAAATLRYVAEVGALDDGPTAAAFHRAGLAPPGALLTGVGA